MMDFEVLYKGEYVDLVSPKDSPYECLHEKDNVIILPIIKNKIGIRYEYCPPYFLKDNKVRNYYTVISGGKDENSIKDTAVRELREEAGIIVKKARLYRLYEGIAFVKNTDMRSSLVLIILEDYEEEKPSGDGTDNEKKSKTIWVSKNELKDLLQKENIDSLLWFISLVVEKVFVKEKLSWKEQPTPYITNPSEVEYWDNYVDGNPWAENSTDVEDLVMNAEILLKRYTEEAPEEDLTEMKFNFYYKILPLAISYLKIKGEMNVGVLEAMLMQNL